MAMPKGREREIAFFLQPYMEKCFLGTCKAVQVWLDMYADAVWEELGSTIRRVLRNTDILQKQKEKGDIQYLVFSFMWHSIYEGKLEMRIEALDDAFYLDEREAAGYYRPEFLLDRFRMDLDTLYRKAGEGFVRLQEYELNGIRTEYAVYYRSILLRMMQGLTGLVMEEVRESGIHTTDRFRILYGEYMERAVILYGEGKINTASRFATDV